MKKIYLVPSTEIVNVTIQQIVAASPLTVVNGEVTEGELQSVDATGAAMSRGGFWDDED